MINLCSKQTRHINIMLHNVVFVTPTLFPLVTYPGKKAGACLGAPYNYAWHVNKITKQELPRT